MKDAFLFFAILITLASCDCTYQYDVLVKNDTGEPIEIKYKTLNDIRGEVEETITVNSGELKKIISTKDIDAGLGCNGISKEHCPMVAEYVKAYKGEIESEKQWKASDVKLANVDIQQGEFILTYTQSDW